MLFHLTKVSLEAMCAENIVILDTRAANSNSNGHNRVDMWMALVCNAFSVLVRETILRQHNAQMHKQWKSTISQRHFENKPLIWQMHLIFSYK